ncbi:Na+/H+ antiporter subunit A [Streptomyces sp. CC210A]|uniref:Na+/H+ antiporter subunit A n=1 Tax=Streptomyces sp. CC210A TaxID=2898184 RepID=UPI001F2DFE4E|nr:Na+/H+ antiporter subunit A [Streptomyces sp. CC210A]
MLLLLALHAVTAPLLPAGARRLGDRVWYAAALVPLLTLAWSAYHTAGVLDGRPPEEDLPWAGTLGLAVDLRLDALSLLMLWIVTGVGVAVLLYARHYTAHDHGREAALMLAFAGAMTGLVLADNLFLLYVFWEATTVVSFLLIAGRGARGERRAAAFRALLVTTTGGLAMLLGFVLLGRAAGTYRISSLVADPPSGGTTSAAVVLVLVGVLAKSAQMPLHGWLPAAMVAPTPVSAYLHAAAMVKAGVYLVARLAPGFADSPPWRPVLLTAALVSLLLAAWRALRETDLKRLLAYGTISELGLLLALFGAGNRTAALAGAAFLAAHAAFKSTLFLTVGVIDHQTGTRTIGELSGLARRMPLLFATAALAAASMAGLPPLAGYVAKEAALEAFLPGSHGTTWPLPAVAAGAALTVAYTARFLRGAFGGRAADGTGRHTDRPAPGFVAPATALAAAGLPLGIGCAGLGAVAQVYADELPEHRPHPYELALWHGWTPALGLSALTLAAGLALYAAVTVHRGPAPPGTPYTDRVHARLRGGLDAAALWFTGRTQVGSLPVYLTVLLLTVAAVVGTAAAVLPQPLGPLHWTSSAVEVPVAAGALAATVAVLRTRHRLTGTLLVGAVGYAVAVLFLLRGAPDLALTQFLVETMTLVVIVLVLRRMPPRFTPARSAWPARVARAVAAGSLGCLVAVLALVTTSAPHLPSVSGGYAALAPETGAGNLVNAIVVDFRALDTLGESAVLLVTAIGVVSLVRVWTRGVPDAPEHAPRPRAAPPVAHWDEPTGKWLPGADERPGEERSVLLEVVTRLLFPSALVLSLFLLFSGHSRPGGGFAGGLVASQAFVLRYLVGGRAGLGAALPVGSGTVAGTGFALCSATALLPVFAGAPPLTSVTVHTHLPVLGTVEFATSLFFDVGVYVLVVGVTLKLLSAVGVSLGRAPAEQSGARP